MISKIAYGWDIDPKFQSYLQITYDIKMKKVLKTQFIETDDKRSFIEKITTSKF